MAFNESYTVFNKYIKIIKQSNIYNLRLKFNQKLWNINKAFIFKLVTKVCAKHTNFTKFANYL